MANDDEVFTAQKQPVAITVLANDTDPDGILDPSTVAIVEGPTNGEMAVDPNTGVVAYTPNPDFSGDDFFRYTVDDDQGATSNAATVTITVTAPNSLLGDLNGDGNLNNLDIGAFKLALQARPAFELDYPNVDANVVGDINGDGAPNSNDVAPFATLLMSRYRPDRREPNDRFDDATDLGTLDFHTETSLTIHTDGREGVYEEEDFFRFEAAESMPAKIEIRFDHGLGNLDLYVYDFTRSLIGSSESTSDDEVVFLDLQQGDTYYVQVVGANGAVHPDFDLLISDTLDPEILSIDPPNGATWGQNLERITLDFSEPLDPATINTQSFRLQTAAGDDDVVDVQSLDGNRTVQLAIAQRPLPAGDYQILIEASAVTDVSGTPVGSEPIVSTFTIVAETTAWNNLSGGSWHVPGNWSTGQLPGPNDNVIIDVPGDVVITHNGTSTINSLYSTNEFRMSGGSLTVGTFVQVEKDFVLSGGATLVGATILPGAEGSKVLLSSSSATFGNRSRILRRSVSVPRGLLLLLCRSWFAPPPGSTGS